MPAYDVYIPFIRTISLWAFDMRMLWPGNKTIMLGMDIVIVLSSGGVVLDITMTKQVFVRRSEEHDQSNHLI